jgi:hypothetical protein
VAAITTESFPVVRRREVSAPVTFRVELEDGRGTTAHLAAFDLAHTEISVVALRPAQPLLGWCYSTGVGHALVGGFFERRTGRPLGELRRAGIALDSRSFLSPWDGRRSCLYVEGGTARLLRRPDLPAAPRGDLLQAGPMLVERGCAVAFDDIDPEGFSAGNEQFDSDITVGRHPRTALGLTEGFALALTCDGHTAEDAGLTLGELAELMIRLGARSALNFDGGGSTTMVCAGRLVNCPREQTGDDIPGGRPVSTAIVFKLRNDAAVH